MPKVHEKVMKFVEETLKKSPDIQLDDLFERAKQVGPEVRDLSKRQFNARYPLQVKRRQALANRAASGSARGGRAGGLSEPRVRGRRGSVATRDSIREVFLQFAKDVSGAEARSDLVEVLANVDRYVDRVLKAVAKA